jgi:hypothetical protein
LSVLVYDDGFPAIFHSASPQKSLRIYPKIQRRRLPRRWFSAFLSEIAGHRASGPSSNLRIGSKEYTPLSEVSQMALPKEEGAYLAQPSDTSDRSRNCPVNPDVIMIGSAEKSRSYYITQKGIEPNMPTHFAAVRKSWTWSCNRLLSFHSLTSSA